MHLADVTFECILLSEDLCVLLFLVFGLFTQLLRLCVHLSVFLLHFFNFLLRNFVCVFLLLPLRFHFVALVRQSADLTNHRSLCRIDCFDDFVDLDVYEELVRADFANGASLIRLVFFRAGRLRVKLSLLHAFAVIGEAAERAKDHLSATGKDVMARGALLRRFLQCFGNGARPEKYRLLMIVLVPAAAQHELAALLREQVEQLATHLLRVNLHILLR